jgi:DNA-binding response OmpR family regulator/PAS domain-containing protein
MKILHVAHDPQMARVPPDAIHAIAQNLTLTCVASPASALEWLQRNTDTAAVIVEVEAQSGAPFVQELRAARLDTPVVIVSGSGRLDTAVAALNSGADGYLLAGSSIERELPELVVKAIDRVNGQKRERRETAGELEALRRQLARDSRTCAALQQQSLRLEDAFVRLEKRRACEAAAFAELLDSRRRMFDERCAGVVESRDALAAQLASTSVALEHEREARTTDGEAARTAYHESERRHAQEIAAAEARFADLESRHGAALAEHLAVRESHEVAYAALERQLAEARSDHQNLLERAVADRAAAEGAIIAAEARFADLASRHTAALEDHAAVREEHVVAYAALEQRLAEAQSNHQNLLERAAADGATAEAELAIAVSAQRQAEHRANCFTAAAVHLEALVAQRDRQLAEETERHLVAEEEAQRAIARLQGDGEALRREIDDARAYVEAIRDIADRVPDLEAQLEKSSREKRSQFERAPYGLCRCSADGTVIEANHSFVTLLGYRRAEDLRDLSWLTAADERTGDLGWLLERARTTRKAETVETQWTTREGRRLLVRLQALVTAGGAIDIVAEDVTALRDVEGRLRQAQKMEAVGRLASEVAVTCEALLGDVVRSAQEWIGSAELADMRVPAERLMEDVTRAIGFLRRLVSHVDEQKRALEPVSAQRVLRDLAPVLRRLVGERIALVLPKSAGMFPVDVDAERLERVLINVVGYARERMPQGGQVKIDLATTAIGRRFAAGHSNVRAGDHVLLTVTELPGSGAMHGLFPLNARPADAAGIELGVLVDLISSCGGHLWLEAQSEGNMVVKIHLPRLAIKEERGGRLSQWLRAASVANIVT